MPVFFIAQEQIHNETVTITGPLLNHLRSSLRIRVGEDFWTGDEQRRRYLVRVTHLDRQQLRAHLLEEQVGPSPQHPSMRVGQALLKGERMDLVIQKVTELGAASLVPLVSHHVIVRPQAGRLTHQRERWQRIALEAAQQAERWDVPSISAPCPAVEFFTQQDPTASRLILCERTEGSGLTSVPLPSGPHASVVIAVGPEGGWRQEELDHAFGCGFVPVTLGARILRGETATLAAVSVLQSRLGELG
ncbi:MAG: RsmE family RNA methyltransferase [Nitrospiraceae bacterium]